jgi:uncharacterized protein YndB with AHSA1/START domain
MRVPLPTPHVAETVRADIEIAAPPDVVFHALADPAELAAWLSGDAAGQTGGSAGFGVPSTPIAGQPWTAPALAPDGSLGSVGGEYLLVDRPRRLESTWRASWDHFAPDRVAFELAPIRVGAAEWTRLTVIHTRAAARRVISAQAGSPGRSEWTAVLARLADHLAASPAAAGWRPGERYHAPRTAWYGDVAYGPVAARRPDGA